MNEDTAGRHILVVDDDPLSRDLCAATLTSRGLETRTTATAAAAREAIATAPPALILLDVNLPDGNGVSVCAALKADAATARIPVVFITGFADAEIMSGAFAAGAADFLTKPVFPDELIARIQNHLAIAARQRALEEEIAHRTRELADSKELLEAVLNGIPDVIGVQDRDRRVIRYNAAGYRFHGKSLEEVKGQYCFEVIGRNNPCDECASRIARETKQPAEIEKFHTGKQVWLLCRSYPILNETGEVQYVIEHLQDITARKQAEKELIHIRNYVDNIINSMPSVLVSVDADGRVTQWNRHAEQQTGVRAAEAVGKNLTDVFPRFAAQMDDILAAMRQRRIHTSPTRKTLVNDELRYEDVTIFPLVANGVEGAVIRVDDVSEKKRFEEMMLQSEKMISVGGLAAGMAHEINNPLGGMLQNAQVLENRFRDDLAANVDAAREAGTTMAAIRAYLEKRRILQMIGMIRESGERATDIVRNMLNFTRKNSSSSSSNDVPALIEETLALMKNDYDLKNDYDFRKIAIERDYAPGLPLILCERSRIQQVLFNVFKNGAQAMAEQRLVTGSRVPSKFVIRVHIRDGMLQIDIADNGPGMDEHIAKRVFEPFFTTKEVGVGTGLGLAVSYFIITETHRGEMRVDSRPGEGTTFIIRLPLPDGGPMSM